MSDPVGSEHRHVWPFIAAGLAFAAVIGVVALSVLTGKDEPHADGPALETPPIPVKPADPPGGGVEARSLDPANLDDEAYLVDSTRRSEFESAAARAKDLAAALRAGEDQWSDLLIDLETSDESVSAYLACAETFLTGTCDYAVDYLIEPSSTGKGQVVYAKASATPGPSPQCEMYAKCMARERLGLTVRVPSETEGTIAYRRTRRENGDPALFKDPDRAAKSLEFLEASLFRIKMQPDDLPDRDYRIAELEAQIRVFKTIVERGQSPDAP